MKIRHFYDLTTNTMTYVIADEISKDAIIIDPVLDFEVETQKVSDQSARTIISYIRAENLNVKGIFDTHAHADHISASSYLKKVFPEAKSGIGEGIRVVQEVFKSKLQMENLKTDGSQFDFLFKDNQTYQFGTLSFKAIATPGHTPACMSYLFDDVVFTGDALFVPDSGTGRCDFPDGCARKLYHSVHDRLYVLPDSTKVFVGHDYCPNGRELKFQTTIGESKKKNIHLKADTSENDYVTFREARDKTLKVPKLLEPSIQRNINP